RRRQRVSRAVRGAAWHDLARRRVATGSEDARARIPRPRGGGGRMMTVIKKELRGYFNSAVAVVFIAAFLAVTLYTFFWQEHFFARGVADLRPLFEQMPKLLIILV